MTKAEELVKKFKEKHGRNPPVLTPQQINLLTEAYTNCANDREACVYAGISTSNFYRWQEVNPEFGDQKVELRDLVKYQARSNIVKSIKEGDLGASQWLLPRWSKDEFSLRIENTGKDGKDLIPDKIIRDDIKGEEKGVVVTAKEYDELKKLSHDINIIKGDKKLEPEKAFEWKAEG
jgi:hypothetical protein